VQKWWEVVTADSDSESDSELDELEEEHLASEADRMNKNIRHLLELVHPIISRLKAEGYLHINLVDRESDGTSLTLFSQEHSDLSVEAWWTRRREFRVENLGKEFLDRLEQAELPEEESEDEDDDE
jgi:hypothetical protein